MRSLGFDSNWCRFFFLGFFLSFVSLLFLHWDCHSVFSFQVFMSFLLMLQSDSGLSFPVNFIAHLFPSFFLSPNTLPNLNLSKSLPCHVLYYHSTNQVILILIALHDLLVYIMPVACSCFTKINYIVILFAFDQNGAALLPYFMFPSLVYFEINLASFIT